MKDVTSFDTLVDKRIIYLFNGLLYGLTSTIFQLPNSQIQLHWSNINFYFIEVLYFLSLAEKQIFSQAGFSRLH